MKKIVLLSTSIFLSVLNFAQNSARSSSSIELDINGVRAMFLNGGDMFWDQPGTGNARYEVPKAESPDELRKNVFNAAALWFGGVDRTNGNVYATSQTYRQSNYSYWPGPVVKSIDNNDPFVNTIEASFWNKHFKVNKNVIDTFRYYFHNGLIPIADSIDSEILNWPAKNNPFINKNEGGSYVVDFNRDLAPFVDMNGDGDYNPMDGDFPDIKGDQSIWWVMNDVGNHKEFGGNQLPLSEGIGLEIQVEAFAFKTEDELKYVTFQSYKVINKGNKSLINSYVGLWVDTELGNVYDNYIGCDTTRNLGYVYNADDFDDDVLGYRDNIPAVGINFCKGIIADEFDGVDNDKDGIIDEEVEELPMTNFLTYWGSSDSFGPHNPSNKNDFYNFLQSKWNSNSYVTQSSSLDDQSSPKTNYVYSGNPITGEGWTEANTNKLPGDRKFIMSMGPFTLEPGDSKEFMLGIPFAQSTLGASKSIEKLFEVSDRVRYACRSDFRDYYSVKEKILKQNFGKVYPTSVDDILNIELLKNEIVTFEVINPLGAIVYSETLKSNQQVSLSNLDSGIYLYRISNSEGVQTGKIIKK